LISQIRVIDVGKSFAVLIVAVIVRVGAVMAIPSRKFNFKERVFMGCAWIPKAAVSATLAGIVLNEAN
jgi:hypothetical protein